MSQKTMTKCDNCKDESEDPVKDGWSKVNLHPFLVGSQEDPNLVDGEPSDNARWLIRDVCPKCAEKIRGWMQGTLVAVFRKPKSKRD